MEPIRYKLPTSTLPGLPYEAHYADMLELRTFFDKRGIPTQNTRIERYTSYLKALVNKERMIEYHIFPGSKDDRFRSALDWLLYVLREVHELMWILKGLQAHVPAGVDSKLKALVSGRDFAALDSNSHSRNTQFELRIASYFCQAGYEVDLTSETDIIASTSDAAFYVECKRIAKSSQLVRRLREARVQLELRLPEEHNGKTAFGCIAADVTNVAFKHNGLTLGATTDHAKDVIQTKLKQIGATTEKLPLFSSNRKILRCFLQIHIPSLVIRPPTVTSRFSFLAMERSERDK
jgi:hypothetical protein